MDFHFICIKSGGSATILDAREKPRYICFKERQYATRYATYICEHKARFGTWPMVNLSTPFVKVRLLDGHSPTDPENYLGLLDVVYKDQDDLDNMSIMTGVNYFYCHEFDYEDLLSMRMRGQDIDGYVDDFLYRENLDYSLNNL